MGGSDDKSNLIVLSVEDHYNAHIILSETSKDMKHKIGNKMSAFIFNKSL